MTIKNKDREFQHDNIGYKRILTKAATAIVIMIEAPYSHIIIGTGMNIDHNMLVITSIF